MPANSTLSALSREGSGNTARQGFRVQGSRFRVQGLRFRVQGLGFRDLTSYSTKPSTSLNQEPCFNKQDTLTLTPLSITTEIHDL